MQSFSSNELNELLLRAIEVYNKYRSPEATAKLLEIEKDSFVLEFSGPFCQSCGVQDYFEDFIYELGSLVDANIELVDVEQTDMDSYKVRYAFRR